MMRCVLSLILFLFFIPLEPVQASGVFTSGINGHIEKSPIKQVKNKYRFFKLTKKAVSIYKTYNDVANLTWLENLAKYKVYSLVNVVENTNFYKDNYNKIVETYKKNSIYNEVPLDYKYKWIYETQDYCLYENVSSMPVKKMHNVDKVITQVYKQDGSKLVSNIGNMGNKFYDYFKRNHSFDVITQVKRQTIYKLKSQLIKQFKRRIF